MAYTAIDDPSAHFHIQLYTGNDGSSRLITNDANAGNFKPDLFWLKNRSTVSTQAIFDSSRLASSEATMMLRAHTTTAGSDKVSRFEGFETDGFTVTSDEVDTNADGDLFVAWQWIANGGTRTTFAESGDDPGGGYQANTTAGFSIVDYTGTGAAGTVTHGLGAVPHLIIIKNRDQADNWAVYHHKNTSAPETDYLVLNEDAATVDDATWWNDTAPSSTVFTVATAHNVNADGENYIAYVWTEIKGYSKFGSYKGNGAADGPFVYIGFKPAMIITKRTTTTTGNWRILDNKRDTYNAVDNHLQPNTTNVDADGYSQHDFLSNGFKLRETDGDTNADGETYIYMAFAKHPFVTSGKVPGTAR